MLSSSCLVSSCFVLRMVVLLQGGAGRLGANSRTQQPCIPGFFLGRLFAFYEGPWHLHLHLRATSTETPSTERDTRHETRDTHHACGLTVETHAGPDAHKGTDSDRFAKRRY